MKIKDKLKSKLLESISVFIGSFIAVFLYDKSSESIVRLLNQLTLSEEAISKAEGFIFSFYVALSYIAVLLLTWFVACIFTRPEIKIEFENPNKERIDELNFFSNVQEPQELIVLFTAKFNQLQLLILQKALKVQLVIGVNPRMCALELSEGFISSSEEYQIENQSVQFDIVSKYTHSEICSTFNLEISVLLINSGNGNINVFLKSIGNKPILNYLANKFCKLQISDLTIKG